MQQYTNFTIYIILTGHEHDSIKLVVYENLGIYLPYCTIHLTWIVILQLSLPKYSLKK